MNRESDTSRVAAALQCLRERNLYFEFDNRERIVKVCVDEVSAADAIAAHVGHLHDLETLRFARTDLTDEGLRHFATLVNLKTLSLEGARITSEGLAHLVGMNRLDKLYIGTARDLDRAAFESIARLSSLRELLLAGGRFCDADLEPLGALAKLEKLSISFHEDDGLSGTFCGFLTRLSALKELSPGEHITNEGLASIAELPHLQELFIDGPFTDAGLEPLKALHRLKLLFVTSKRVTPVGLEVVADLPELATLWLRVTPLTDECVPTLAKCRTLTSLNLCRTDLTPSARKRLAHALPACVIEYYDAPDTQES